VAQIIEVERLEDGRMNLITRGLARFEILEIKQIRPYLVGQVKVLNIEEIEAHENLEPLAMKANRLYRTYESLFAQLISDWKAPEQIPTSPRHLSYQIGNRLQIPLEEKQKLLETLPIHQLLSREIELLDRENQRLKAGLIARSAFGGRQPHAPPLWNNFSLN
jgi:ATP-dependent Lon protease